MIIRKLCWRVCSSAHEPEVQGLLINIIMLEIVIRRLYWRILPLTNWRCRGLFAPCSLNLGKCVCDKNSVKGYLAMRVFSTFLTLFQYQRIILQCKFVSTYALPCK